MQNKHPNSDSPDYKGGNDKPNRQPRQDKNAEVTNNGSTDGHNNYQTIIIVAPVTPVDNDDDRSCVKTVSREAHQTRPTTEIKPNITNVRNDDVEEPDIKQRGVQ